MSHAYTEDQLVEQPATKGKAEGEMLKAEVLSPEVVAVAEDELTRRVSALHPLSGAVNLKPN
jgi:hypothetical protein